jgi:hypothetical protein
MGSCEHGKEPSGSVEILNIKDYCCCCCFHPHHLRNKPLSKLQMSESIIYRHQRES